MQGNRAARLLKDTFSSWSKDKTPRLAAALAYYTVFSIAPLLLICIAIAGLIFGKATVGQQIIDQIGHTLGKQTAEAVAGMTQSADKPHHGIIASAVGIIALLFGAAGVFGQLKDALNTIWEVQPRPGRGLWGMIKDRFLSLTMVLGVSFLLLVSLVLTTALAAFSKFAGGGMAPGLTWVGPVLDLIVSTGVVTVLFALIFKVLPDAEVPWRDVWVGAFLTALLFTLGKFLLGLYLSRPGVASAYGAAGSLIVLLLWVYYSAQILFFGAEFTKVYAREYGSKIVPEKDAVAVTQAVREQQGMPERGTGGRAPAGRNERRPQRRRTS